MERDVLQGGLVAVLVGPALQGTPGDLVDEHEPSVVHDLPRTAGEGVAGPDRAVEAGAQGRVPGQREVETERPTEVLEPGPVDLAVGEVLLVGEGARHVVGGDDVPDGDPPTLLAGDPQRRPPLVVHDQVGLVDEAHLGAAGTPRPGAGVEQDVVEAEVVDGADGDVGGAGGGPGGGPVAVEPQVPERELGAEPGVHRVEELGVAAHRVAGSVGRVHHQVGSTAQGLPGEVGAHQAGGQVGHPDLGLPSAGLLLDVEAVEQGEVRLDHLRRDRLARRRLGMSRVVRLGRAIVHGGDRRGDAFRGGVGAQLGEDVLGRALRHRVGRAADLGGTHPQVGVGPDHAGVLAVGPVARDDPLDAGLVGDDLEPVALEVLTDGALGEAVALGQLGERRLRGRGRAGRGGVGGGVGGDARAGRCGSRRPRR